MFGYLCLMFVTIQQYVKMTAVISMKISG